MNDTIGQARKSIMNLVADEDEGKKRICVVLLE